MKFVRYDSDNLGVLTEDERGIIDLTRRLDLESHDPLVEYLQGNHSAVSLEGAQPDVSLADVTIGSPVRRPGKIVAAPGNYADHQAEMSGGPTTVPSGYFLKAPSSVVGPSGTIELPFTDRRFDHEIELAFVMGEEIRDASPETVADATFGYTILLDVSMRGDEDRSNRKSYDTFTAIGPCVATPEEVGDPQDLSMKLRLNDELQQDADTAQMILSCAEFGALASVGTTIEAGDVVTTGTPSGVSELADGDVVSADIESIGSMTLDVRERNMSHAQLGIGE